MKQILVLGAGKSTPALIRFLLDNAEEHDWHVTVGDLDVEMARERVAGHARGDAIQFDVNDSALRDIEIEKADVVVNLLAPTFQSLVAWDCVNHGTHMVSASYRDRELRALESDCLRKNMLILTEMGLDPGIDHMSAMALIERIRRDGGEIKGFCSYGSGLPAPGPDLNPLGYAITWNPRNVVRAGAAGAQYMEKDQIKIVPYNRVFHHTWSVDVDQVGLFEAYPNRDSLGYMELFGLEGVDTMIRGTLRYPGWSETWAEIVRVGLPNEMVRIPDLQKRTYREVLEMFLPLIVSGSSIDKRLARYLQISPTGTIMQNLQWLGLFDDTKIAARGETAADMMSDLLERKLPLKPGQQDMVILQHELEVQWPARGGKREKVISTMVEYGSQEEETAMARTVGLPAAIAVKMILKGDLRMTGCHIPTHPAIYEPVLAELGAHGIKFTDRTEPIAETDAD